MDRQGSGSVPMGAGRGPGPRRPAKRFGPGQDSFHRAASCHRQGPGGFPLPTSDRRLAAAPDREGFSASPGFSPCGLAPAGLGDAPLQRRLRRGDFGHPTPVRLVPIRWAASSKLLPKEAPLVGSFQDASTIHENSLKEGPSGDTASRRPQEGRHDGGRDGAGGRAAPWDLRPMGVSRPPFERGQGREAGGRPGMRSPLPRRDAPERPMSMRAHRPNPRHPIAQRGGSDVVTRHRRRDTGRGLPSDRRRNEPRASTARPRSSRTRMQAGRRGRAPRGPWPASRRYAP